MHSQVDVTELLNAYGSGHREALDKLMPIVYAQLRKLAHARLRDERPDHTLNTTGLVHEAYLRLIDVNRIKWDNRGHFFAMASKVMRRILVNYALRRKAGKRGGGAAHEELDEEHLVPEAQVETLLELDDALKRLEVLHPRQAEALQHRYFGGLSNEETAEALGASITTVERDLRFGRAWLACAWSRESLADL